MWNCSHYQSLSRKESPKLYCCSLFGDSTCHQSYRSLCDLLSLWEFCQDGPLPSPWFPTGRNGARNLSWFYSDRFDPKEHRKAVHEHDFRDLSKGQKLFQVLVQAIDEFFDTGRYLVFGCLFASLVQVYVPTRILTSISATPVIAILLLMVLSFLLSLCSEADAFVGSSLLTSFGVAPVLAFLVIGPMLDVKNLLMMKNYLKTRFIWQFIGIVSGVVLLYAWFVGVVL